MSKQLKAKILELEIEIIALKSFNETLEHKVEELQSGIKVDVARYLKTPEGKAALDRIQKSSERFRK